MAGAAADFLTVVSNLSSRFPTSVTLMDDLGVRDGVGDNNLTETRNGWAYSDTFEFIVHGVLVGIVGVLGLIGNIISIVILSRPQMKSSINAILIGLVSCDSLLILTSFLLFTVNALGAPWRLAGGYVFNFYYWEIYPYILPFVYPIALSAQTGSAYMTLCVTFERYLVVCWPLRARHLCTVGRAKLAVIIFFLFAVSYNVPRFFELTYSTEFLEELGENKTVIEATPLRKNPIYINVYVTWMYFVFMYIIPFASLAVFNLLIFLAIRRANATRAILSNQEKKDHNLAVMLLVVVVVFFLCNILALVSNILEQFGTINDQLIQVSNLLVTINSSVNILIYCIFGNKFKMVFMKIFCGRRSTPQMAHRSGFVSAAAEVTCGVGGGGGGIGSTSYTTTFSASPRDLAGRIAADERISLHSGVGSNVASSAANSSVFTEYTVTANGSFRKTKTTNGVTETTVFVEKKPVMLC